MTPVQPNSSPGEGEASAKLVAVPDVDGPQRESLPPPSFPPPSSASRLVSEIQIYVARHQATLSTLIDRDDPKSGGDEVGRRLCRATDSLLRALFAMAVGQVLGKRGCGGNCEVPIALAAVGSYGRGSVSLRSDLDVRLVSKLPHDDVAKVAEAMLYPLWDGGLMVGHQIVTPDELVTLACSDLPTATSLLDLRHLAGSEAIVDEVRREARARVFGGEGLSTFLARLEGEVLSRRERFGGSVYLLEPDVKLGAGGLRDFDVAMWVAKARWGARELGDLVGAGVLLPHEVARAEQARDLLSRVRNRLHNRTGRRTDRLTFDLQEELAFELGYGSREELEQAAAAPQEADRGEGGDLEHDRVIAVAGAAAEALMSDYYARARDIAALRDRLSMRARAVAPRRKSNGKSITKGLCLLDDQVAFASAEAPAAEPSLCLKLFSVAWQRGVPVHPMARDAVARLCGDPAFAARLRAEPEAGPLFIELCGVAGLREGARSSPLADLHDTGLLVSMVPEFVPVVGRVHHDIYHVYTVDVHSVAAVDRLHALMRGDLSDTHPHACRVAAEVSQPDVLSLATLLHDVGKAIRGRDHAERGADVSKGICTRLGLAEADADYVAHLVRTHLLMYHVATRRDIDDPSTIDDFLRELRGADNLRDLYALTVADVSTTSPTALTAWKARLLDELFVSTDRRLSAGDADGKPREARVQAAKAAVAARAGADPVAQAMLAGMPDRYFLSTSVERVLTHVDIVRRGLGEGLAVELLRDAPDGHAEIVAVTADRPGLLSQIAAAITAARLDVHQAHIYTLKLADGRRVAVDTFWVRGPGIEGTAAGRTPRAIERDVGALLRGEKTVATVLSTRSQPAKVRAEPPVRTEITVDDRASLSHGVIEVLTRDRPGLLCLLSATLHGLGLSIALAKINTEGTRAADVFYVSDEHGKKVVLAPLAQTLRERVMAALAPPPPEERPRP